MSETPGAPALLPPLASHGTPRLHTLARAPLLPELDLPGAFEPGAASEEPGDADDPLAEDLDPGPLPDAMAGVPPESLDESPFAAERDLGTPPPGAGAAAALAAGKDAPPGEPGAPLLDGEPLVPDAAATPAAEEDAQLGELARQSAEEVGLLGMLRVARGSAAWSRGLGAFEQRLLEHLDALVALAHPFPSLGDGGAITERRIDVLAVLFRHAAAGLVPDPARAFARTFVLGCVAGDDTVRAAVAGLARAHPSTHDAHRLAFTLAPHRGVRAAMEGLCTGERPALARLALDVLRARGEVGLGVAAGLLHHPDAGVRASAARCLGALPARAAALTLLEGLLDDEDDDRVGAAAAASLLLQDSPSGLVFARRRLDEELELPDTLAPRARIELLRLVALAGDASDADRVRRSLRGRPEEAAAAGWLGHVALVEPLLALATTAHEARRGEGPASPLETAALAAVERIAGAPERAPGAAPSAASARAFWAGRRAGLDPALKHRAGELFTPRASLAELWSDAPALAEARAACAFELALLSGGRFRVEPDDWVARQGAAIDALRPWAEAPGSAPGEWPAQRLGRRHG